MGAQSARTLHQEINPIEPRKAPRSLSVGARQKDAYGSIIPHDVVVSMCHLVCHSLNSKPKPSRSVQSLFHSLGPKF